MTRESQCVASERQLRRLPWPAPLSLALFLTLFFFGDSNAQAEDIGSTRIRLLEGAGGVSPSQELVRTPTGRRQNPLWLERSRDNWQDTRPDSWRGNWRHSSRDRFNKADSGPTGRDFFPGRDPAWRPDETTWWKLDRDTSFGMGYGASLNRADGFSVLFSQALENPGGGLGFRIYESYGFASEEWSGAGEISLGGGSSPFTIGARWADETVAWLLPLQAITTEENFVAAFFDREDFSDYLRRRGRSYFLTISNHGREGVEVSYSEDRHTSLRRRIARFGIFGGDSAFSSNPAVDEGDWHVLRARSFWKEQGRGSIWGPDGGKALLLDAQWSGGDLGGERFFTRIWGEHRGEFRLSRAQSLRYRIAAGATPQGRVADNGSRLPKQWQFFAGGVGTLRGHEFHEFVGDRLLLGTVEYGLDFDSSIRPVLFVDGGKAWNESQNAAEGIGGSGELPLDGGIGFLFGSDGFRIDVARDLRRERASAIVTVRMFHAL